MTDYAKGLQASTSELAPDTRTETLSIDQDSIMTDVDIVDDTPQTRSLAQSESLNASEDSTRPSTPTGVPFGRPAVDSRTPTAIDPNDANDDIQMVDVSPVKDRPAELSSGFSKPSMPSWHPNTNVKTVREEYATDPFKLQKPLDSGDPEVYEPHKLG